MFLMPHTPPKPPHFQTVSGVQILKTLIIIRGQGMLCRPEINSCGRFFCQTSFPTKGFHNSLPGVQLSVRGPSEFMGSKQGPPTPTPLLLNFMHSPQNRCFKESCYQMEGFIPSPSHTRTFSYPYRIDLHTFHLPAITHFLYTVPQLFFFLTV